MEEMMGGFGVRFVSVLTLGDLFAGVSVWVWAGVLGCLGDCIFAAVSF